MSRWTHAICDNCWDARHPDKLSPRRGAGPLEECCYCQALTRSGIYVREDPAEVPCHGHHAREE